MGTHRSWNSCIYEGTIRHRRMAPVAHAFTYPIFLMYLDLNEIDQLFEDRFLWSSEKFNLAQFRRRDHLAAYPGELRQALGRLIEARIDRSPEGPIRLLTHLRYFGYCFNPVSFYYCFDSRDERVEIIVAEVNNTPWGEQFHYVLSSSDSIHKMEFFLDKEFHVSPFMDLDVQYRWCFTQPGSNLSTHMENFSHGQKFFDATLSLRRVEITTLTLASALFRFPFMTGQVIATIYWNAFQLWLKGCPSYSHPATSTRFTRS